MERVRIQNLLDETLELKRQFGAVIDLVPVGLEVASLQVVEEPALFVNLQSIGLLAHRVRERVEACNGLEDHDAQVKDV